MFCLTCGTENRDGAIRCKECGNAITNTGTFPIVALRQEPATAKTLFEGGKEKSQPAPPPPVSANSASSQQLADPAISSVVQRPVLDPDLVKSKAPIASTRQDNGVDSPKTVFQLGAVIGASVQPSEAPKNRKIVGILVTYTWQPDGQMFPIREGRNLIGRDAAKCDIAITHDPAMSEITSHITFRKTFIVGDMVSMNGTLLDGAPVETQFVSLPNMAQIRCGSTDFVFVAIPDLGR